MAKNQTPEPRREPNQTSNAMRVRTLVLVAFFIIFGFGLLVYQLYALQLRDPESNRTKAMEQQLSDDVIPATRGNIYSSTGKLLAKSSVVWNITADPSACNQAFVAQASQEIAQLLGGSVTAESIQEKLSDTESKYKVIAKGVDMPTAQAIMDYANTKQWVDANGNPTSADAEGAEQEKVLYFYSEQSSTREYPYGSFLSSVLGFCNADGDGMYGLEKSYNEELAGTPGRSITTQNAFGYELADADANVHEAINGYNLNLTIDDNIQLMVEQCLADAIEEYNVKNRGAAIVMDVNTGEIYAMATMDQFDPNDPYTIQDAELAAVLDSGTLTPEGIDLLQSRLGEDAVADIVADGVISDDEYTTLQGYIREAQWKNKNVTELYYPGSVFKLVTASAALDSGLMDASQQYYCSGEMTLFPDTVWETSYHCAEGEAHGWMDMASALNYSCNLYFIQAAEAMSPEFFYSYFQAFGLAETTGIDLPYESKGISKTQADMEKTATDLYSSAFGQSQKLTTIQMATAVAAVVNGGYLVTPHVVDTITDENGNVVEEIGTNIRRQVISEEVSEQICAMMEDNVGHNDDDAYHSCQNAYVAGYRIGGKSGTAEQLDRELRSDGDYHKAISFAGVLPINDPEILVFVMLDDPRWTYDYASQLVAPLVGNIISEIAPYLGIERDESYAPDGYVTVPNAVGTRWTSAQVALNKLGLSHKLIGSSDGDIIYQYPYTGAKVPAGSTIYFYTETDQDAMTTVPDVAGKTGAFAQQMLKASGLNVDLQGDENARVSAQSVAAGSSVPYGTIITLETEAAAEPAQESDSEESNQESEAPAEESADGEADAG